MPCLLASAKATKSPGKLKCTDFNAQNQQSLAKLHHWHQTYHYTVPYGQHVVNGSLYAVERRAEPVSRLELARVVTLPCQGSLPRTWRAASLDHPSQAGCNAHIAPLCTIQAYHLCLPGILASILARVPAKRYNPHHRPLYGWEQAVVISYKLVPGILATPILDGETRIESHYTGVNIQACAWRAGVDRIHTLALSTLASITFAWRLTLENRAVSGFREQGAGG